MASKREDERGQPRPIDDIEDRMGEIDQLSFDEDEPVSRAGDKRSQAEIDLEQSADRVREAGLTGASMPGQGPTEDDLSPETLIDEDGARSPDERGRGLPADKDLTVTDRDHIGGGRGLDEAELGRARPLDGKPWDGDPGEPLRPMPEVDTDRPTDEPAAPGADPFSSDQSAGRSGQGRPDR